MTHAVSFENYYFVQFSGTIGNLLGGTNFDAVRSGSSFTVGKEIFNLFADPGISYPYLGTSPSGDAGDDMLTAGGGVDQFIFDDGWGKDKITDFNVDQDKLNFKAVLGVTEVADLTITANAQGIRISDGSDVFILQGLSAGDISDLDFIF